MIFRKVQNEEYAHSLNPIRHEGDCIALETERDTPPIEVRTPDGSPAFTLESGGAGLLTDLVPEEYEAIIASAGVDDDGTTIDDPRVEDEAHRNAMPIVKAPLTPMQQHRGVDVVRVARAQAVLRSFGLAPSKCTINGHTYGRRRSFLHAGRAGRDFLDHLRAQAEDLARHERATAEAFAVASRVNTKTLAELSMEAILIPRIGSSQLQYPGDVFPILENAEGLYVMFHAIEGWPVPAVPIATGRFLPRDTVIPLPESSLPHVPEASHMLSTWVREARDAHCKIDTGPISWGALDSIANVFGHRSRRGRELAARWQRVLYAGMPADPSFWRRAWLPLALVRGLRLKPEVAVEIIMGAVDNVRGRRDSASFGAPSAFAMRGGGEVRPIFEFTRAETETACLAASKGGPMSAGALLDEPTPPPKRGAAAGVPRAA